MADQYPSLPYEREHTIFALGLLNVYLLMVEGEMLPGFNQPDFIQRLSVRLLLNKMERVAIDMPTTLNCDELCLVYLACLLGNKVLQSEKAPFISGMILQQVRTDHPLKRYEQFQKYMLENNAQRTRQIEQNYAPVLNDLPRWKERIAAFSVI